ncbi:antitoxin [Aliarcobacter butzleri]|jgi:antitoxin VapB|uniref:antitoxin n=1 Tax=Aliarcobacter butzleri TaxID=28197 RepID=UPI001EDA26AD|nr:type II toxin-antitoxin system VapB family antitoxin [Aliarcobacter butzleri]MCG3672977.1 type II toxin-antitoxin system VapB family antitoxin [Aliarcobacter butzleri]MCG3691278.1 type II toxin-antitoxin system VapB family antitoxin [Aliarcobacter butzleri]
MTAIAKIFKNGQSQAVRLPKEFRFENQEELFVKKVEDGIILLPKNDKSVWDNMFDRLDEFSDDFMETRVQPTQNREDLF